jgi:hypothetical protein
MENTVMDLLLIGIVILIILDHFMPHPTDEMKRKKPLKFWLVLVIGVLAGLTYFSSFLESLWSAVYFIPNFRELTGDGVYDDLWFYLAGIGLVIVLPAAIYVYLRIKADKKVEGIKK